MLRKICLFFQLGRNVFFFKKNKLQMEEYMHFRLKYMRNILSK